MKEYNKSPKINIIAIYKVHENTTLLEFLYTRVNDSKNNIKTYLKNKQFLVNGIPISQFNEPLVKGDVITFARNRFKKEIEKKKSSFKLDIIYEDEYLIALNKPSGLLSIESDSEKVDTIYNYVYDYVKRTSNINRVYLIHRIDKDTSGVIVFAKDETTRNVLSKRWNELVSLREYIAICSQKFEKKKDTIKSYLYKNETNNLMYETKDKSKGKLSITHYEVLKENSEYSLVDLKIDSGRKNQIRVHMKGIGHEVIGDDKYGKLSSPIGRLCLHAYKLEFYNPINKKTYLFKAPIPKEFNKLIP